MHITKTFPYARALVTGGTGAIGSALVRRLLTEKAVRKVVVVDNLSSGCRRELPKDPRISFIKGDIADARTVALCFNGKPDVVFHLAAHFANQNSVDHPLQDLRTNVEGTVRLLEYACVRGVRRFVYASSSCVYPASRSPLHERMEPNPRSTPYAISKLAGEHYAEFHHRHHDLDVVTLRFFNSYGPSEHPGRYRNVIPNFFARALRGLPLEIFGTGREARSYTYLDDTVEGIMRAGYYPGLAGEIVNIGSGMPTRTIDLAKAINKLTGNAAGIVLMPRRGWDHVTTRRPDIRKMKRVLGFEARTPLAVGLHATHEWFVKNRRHLLG